MLIHPYYNRLVKNGGQSDRPNLLRQLRAASTHQTSSGPDLHQLHLHGHDPGEDGPRQRGLSQAQGILQRKIWARVSGSILF